MRKSEETIADELRLGSFDKLDKLCRAVLFRILAEPDVRVAQILPTFRVVINLPMGFLKKVVINLPMSFPEKTVRVAPDLRHLRKDSPFTFMNLS
jgi:hypothetical protein